MDKNIFLLQTNNKNYKKRLKSFIQKPWKNKMQSN